MYYFYIIFYIYLFYNILALILLYLLKNLYV